MSQRGKQQNVNECIIDIHKRNMNSALLEELLLSLEIFGIFYHMMVLVSRLDLLSAETEKPSNVKSFLGIIHTKNGIGNPIQSNPTLFI